MEEKELRAEVCAQWGGDWQRLDWRRQLVADKLVFASLIAWQSLAGNLSDAELAVLADIAHTAGTRSTKPRTVLRKMIEFAQTKYDWEPTPDVLKAAGIRVPR